MWHGMRKRLVFVVMAVGFAVLSLPVLTRPTFRANRAEIEKLQAEYERYGWTADGSGMPDFEMRRKLWGEIHLLGAHYDEGHEGCEYGGYSGSRKILATRLGRWWRGERPFTVRNTTVLMHRADGTTALEIETDGEGLAHGRVRHLDEHGNVASTEHWEHGRLLAP